MPLWKVRLYDDNKGIGIEASANAYVHDKERYLCLLSVVGPESAVKGITSAVSTGRSLEIFADETLELHASWFARYRILSARLRCGVLHQILAQEGFFAAQENNRLLLVPPGQLPEDLAFHVLDGMAGTPLIPEWKTWLLERLKAEGHIEELQGTLRAFKLQIHEAALDALVSEAVGQGELSFFSF